MVQGYLYLWTKELETRLSADNPLISRFWETLHYLNRETNKEAGCLNHCADAGLNSVNRTSYA